MSPDTHSHMNTLSVAKTLGHSDWTHRPPGVSEGSTATQASRHGSAGGPQAGDHTAPKRQVPERLGAVGSDAERDSESR